MSRRKRAKPNERLIAGWRAEIDRLRALEDSGHQLTLEQREYLNGLYNCVALEQRRGARYIGDLGVKGMTW